MHRIIALLLALILVAAACGGDDGDDDTTSGGTDNGDDTSSDDGDEADSDGADEAAGGGDASGDGGGAADQGLVETLGLPECPVGAHLDTDGPVGIVMWHPYTAETEQAMEDVAAAFNAAQSDIVVSVEAQGSYGELLAKYRESINFDDLPAVAITDEGTFRDMVDSGTVLPAQSCVEAEGYELTDIDELVRQYYSLDGALWPAAMNVSTPVLFYNRDHFEAAGLDPDTPPATIEEVQAAAQVIKDAGVAETPLSFLMQGWFAETWLTGAGVPLVNADNGRAGNATEATFNGPEALEIFTRLQEMSDAGLMVAVSNTPGQLSHFLALATPGTASMVIETSTASTTIAGVLGGTSNLADLVAEAGIDGEILGTTDLAINIDVAPMPGLVEPGRIFISGGAYYMTASGSEAEQAAAWEFMKFLNQLEQQKVIHLKGSYLPINPAVVADAEVQTVWETDAAGQWLATAHAQLADIDPDFLGPAVGPFSEQRAAIDRALEDVILAGVDPQTALDTAEDEVNAALEAYTEANF